MATTFQTYTFASWGAFCKSCYELVPFKPSYHRKAEISPCLLLAICSAVLSELRDHYASARDIRLGNICLLVRQ